MSLPNAAATPLLRISTPRRRLWWLLGVSCALKLLYVFACTEYSQYLFSDFGGYWERALQRYQGVDVDSFQWAVWPPLPHILLNWAFHLIDLLGLQAWRLESVLAANVLLSTVGVACLYGITLRLTSSSRFALVAAAAYALWFPLWYLNAFVMSEHPATAAVLLAVWCLVRHPGHSGYLAAAGALLGLAVGLRPALGLMALPCGLFAMFAGPYAKISIKQAAVFSLGFAVVIGGTIAEVSRISHGEVRGLSANGGLNFYFAQCRTHEVVSRHGSTVYYLVPPATVVLPENGSLTVARPFHDQAFFANLGWQCVRAQPTLWWRNVTKLNDLFFGPLLPEVDTAVGFRALLPAFRWGALAVACLLPLGLCVAYRARRRSVAVLLAGIVAVSLATQYVFNAEHRYLYPIFGFMLALAAWSIAWAYRVWPKSRLPVAVYAGVLAVVVLGTSAHVAWQQFKTPTVIEAPWSHTLQPFDGRPKPEGQFVVDTLRFPPGRTLRHVVRSRLDGAPEESQQVAIDFSTCLDVATAGEFEFAVASDDGFELRIDERVVTAHYTARPYRATRGSTFLAPGRHRYLLHYYQATDQLGVAAVWRRSFEGGRLMPAVSLRDVGEGGDGVRFLPPRECAATPRGAG